MATYESKKYNFSGANITSIAATGIADGSVDNTEYQFINSLSSNAQTQITGRLQTAGGTMTGSIVFPDDSGPAPAKIQMGAGTDLKMYSDGTNGVVSVLNALSVTNNDASETLLYAVPNGSVGLNHNAINRLVTQSGGCQVTGALGVGITSVGATAGELRATNEVTAYYSSDERLKENISTIENALEKVNSMRGVYFDWKDKENNDNERQLGFIAQEVETVVPELVKESQGIKSVNYSQTVALLLEAIKEQGNQIKQLQDEVADLKSKIN